MYFIGEEMLDETNISTEEEKAVKTENESTNIDTREEKTNETEKQSSIIVEFIFILLLCNKVH